MRLAPTSLRGASALLLLLAQTTEAERMLRALVLAPCMENSGFQASLFNVTFTPDDEKVRIKMNAQIELEGMVTTKITVRAYGFNIIDMELDPCTQKDLKTLCPMTMGQLPLDLEYEIMNGATDQIPGIAYSVPDIDAVAQMEVFSKDTGERVACVEAPLSNGHTMEQEVVGWVTAVVAGVALVVSAIISGFGHNWTAAHVAANALSLFSYFQAQSMISMVAVPLPPLVSAWTQNYDWAMGIIRIKFMQNILHWYVQATGGTPSNINLQQTKVSVLIAKRSLGSVIPKISSRAAMWGFTDYPEKLVKRAGDLVGRSNSGAVAMNTELMKVTGIERMAYKANIEVTNFFLTGMSFFVAFLFFVTVGVAAFRWIYIELAHRKMRPDAFRDFRARWLLVLKGIMYRIYVIGFPQMMLLCAWEWTSKDSPAAIVLAVFFFLSMMIILCFACFKVISLALASRKLDSSTTNITAYKLFNDPAALNRWGYLYVQFRRETFYFIIIVLAHMLLKSFFIALMQPAGKAQAVAILVIELAYLVTVSIVRPWLDKRTNIVNIAIAAVNFINAICVLIFSRITTAGPPVIGVLGIIFFVINAIFTLVLVVLVIITAAMAIFSKNPEKRFQAVGTVDEKRPPAQIRDLDDGDLVAPVSQTRRESVNTEQAMSIRGGATQQDLIRPIAGELRPSPSPGAGLAPSSPSPSEGVQHGPVNWQSGAGYDRAA